MKIEIIYEDNHLLVVEKPINIPVQQDNSRDPDLLSILKEDLKIRYNKPGNVYLGLVHRLDRPVGGVMVFAKTSKAASRLADSLRRKDIKRKYLAVVRGHVKNKSARLEDYLFKNQERNIVTVVPSSNKQGKKAILNYELLERVDNLSLLSVQLETGRSHQIRVQLAETGHPLYGDQKYGQKVNKPGQQIALWARELSFPHPTRRDEVLTFKSSPPLSEAWLKFAPALTDSKTPTSRLEKKP